MRDASPVYRSSGGEPGPKRLHPPRGPGNRTDRRYAAAHDSPSNVLCSASMQSSVRIVRRQCRGKSPRARPRLTNVVSAGEWVDVYHRAIRICLAQTCGGDQTTVQSRGANRRLASDLTSAPSASRCNKSSSGTSSATFPSPDLENRCYIHRLKLQVKPSVQPGRACLPH